jgi:two-component system CheB/CheR fusion protein
VRGSSSPSFDIRVRNLLGVIRSLVRRTAESAASAEEYSLHLEGRINALARTQALVMRGPSAGVDLEELVDAELIAHAARETRLESAGPPVRLRAKAAETLALALHELVTNARQVRRAGRGPWAHHRHVAHGTGSGRSVRSPRMERNGPRHGWAPPHASGFRS